jgi:hypothetical protein
MIFFSKEKGNIFFNCKNLEKEKKTQISPGSTSVS